MTRWVQVILVGLVLGWRGGPAHGQANPDPPSFPRAGLPPVPPVPPAVAPAPPPQPRADELESIQQELTALRRLDAQSQPPTANEVDRLRKQLELQRKQMEVLERMLNLLAEEVKKNRAATQAVEQLQTQGATLEARAEQAARRDQELAQATDALREQADAARNNPTLPATLRETFLPTRPNQSPLSIYGTLSVDYQDFQDRGSTFPSPVFSPHFYLLLNEQFLLEVNPDIRADQIQLESAQLDWFAHDNLTLVVGRFYSPLGFFNERLHTSWLFKTPDRPLIFQQVYPSPLSQTGVMARGAAYLGDLPVKLEYATFLANGFSLTATSPTARNFADLRAMKDVFDDVNQGKAVGGRLGLSIPEIGLIAGVSGYDNGAYDRRGQHSLSSWLADVSWHRGNWDYRFEYARTNQQSPFGPIHRQGFYTQLAYRPYDSPHAFLSRLEGVARYDYVEFDGINLAATGLDFGGRDRVPVDRSRYTVGLNYYPYPSLILKVAYQVADELRFRELKDNGFIAQLAWGF